MANKTPGDNSLWLNIDSIIQKDNVSFIGLMMECNEDFLAIEEKLAKSIVECRKLENEIDSLKIRVHERENYRATSRVRRTGFRGINAFATSGLKNDLSLKQNKLKQEILNRDRIKQQCQQKAKYRDRLRSILTVILIEYWIRIHKIDKLLDRNVKTMIIHHYPLSFDK